MTISGSENVVIFRVLNPELALFSAIPPFLNLAPVALFIKYLLYLPFISYVQNEELISLVLWLQVFLKEGYWTRRTLKSFWKRENIDYMTKALEPIFIFLLSYLILRYSKRLMLLIGSL